MKRPMRWIWRGLAGLALVAILVTVGGVLWLRTSLPQVGGTIQIPAGIAGPSKPVEIIRDARAVPHITASSATDAYFALGFVHAQDRLFQMDFSRRLGAGRLAEVMGARLVRLDKVMRTLGIYRLAEQDARRLAPEIRDAFESYAAGVNAYLRVHAGALAPEFYLLRYRPELWKPADSLVWGRLMALRLSGNSRTESLRAALAKRLSEEQIESLWPPYPGETGLTLGRAEPALAPLFGSIWKNFAEVLERAPASNSWVLAGRHTTTGKPILANDPHLDYSAPGIWYLARLQAPGLQVTGATVPGVPLTVLGHNGRIAWGMTTTQGDTQDLFIERLAPGRRTHYQTPEGPRRFTSRTEIIRVRGADDVVLTVRGTRHGPVLSDARPQLTALAPAGHVIALAATALGEEDVNAEAVFRLNRAGDWKGFLEAMAGFRAPQQNISYADVTGNTGFIAPARVPIRKTGFGLKPVAGWTGAYDWVSFIPFEGLPRSFNPPSGRIVTANHKIVDDDYPYFLGSGWDWPYRARRVHQLLDASPRLSPMNISAMQGDTVSLMARDLLPKMLVNDGGGELAQKALSLLRRWDGRMARDRPEPLIFTAWLRELNRRIYADELGPMFRDYWRLRPVFIAEVLSRRPRWCDDVKTEKTETCREILSESLSSTLRTLAVANGEDIAAWRWGARHYAYFRHRVFGFVPGLRDLADIRIAADGGAYTLNRGLTRVSDPRHPMAAIHGPGFRAAYDLADLDASLYSQATGQSGNIFSPHYRDLTRIWRDNRGFPISTVRDEALREKIGVLTLQPQNQIEEPCDLGAHRK